MHHTYILQSGKDGRWYTGSTGDLRMRVKDHLNGRVNSTPFQALQTGSASGERVKLERDPHAIDDP